MEVSHKRKSVRIYMILRKKVQKSINTDRLRMSQLMCFNTILYGTYFNPIYVLLTLIVNLNNLHIDASIFQCYVFLPLYSYICNVYTYVIGWWFQVCDRFLFRLATGQ